MIEGERETGGQELLQEEMNLGAVMTSTQRSSLLERPVTELRWPSRMLAEWMIKGLLWSSSSGM